MNDIVLIKGNKTGLTIMLNDSVSMALIKKTLYEKLCQSKKFFGNSKITLSFKGRELNDMEYSELIDIVGEATNLEIMCVIDENTNHPIFEDEEISHQPLENDSSGAIFHKGTLRSGQELVVDASVIIIGNIHTGATVISKGNVIVIGELKGTVYAGSEGNQNSFIVALKMNPLQLKIGDIFGRSSNLKPKDLDKPKIAFVENNRIFIEKINRNIYKDIDFLNYK
jgi:septum site-determining protein MinC